MFFMFQTAPDFFPSLTIQQAFSTKVFFPGCHHWLLLEGPTLSRAIYQCRSSGFKQVGYMIYKPIKQVSDLLYNTLTTPSSNPKPSSFCPTPSIDSQHLEKKPPPRSFPTSGGQIAPVTPARFFRPTAVTDSECPRRSKRTAASPCML